MIFSAVLGFFKGVLAKKVFGFTIGTIITATFTAATFIMGVKAYRMMKDMQSQGQDILANKTSAGGKIPVIYGARRVGTQIIYMDTASNNSKELFVIYALSVGEVENIDGQSIELDGNLISDSNRFKDGGYIGSDKINSGAGSLNTANNTNAITTVTAGTFGTNPALSYRMVFNLHHGAATQTADPMFTASIGSQWTAAHKLNGVAYIAAKYSYDTEGMWSGVPQLTVIVEGKKVFDPRDSTQTFGTISTYKWSDNPALCFLDYITNDEYGKGLPIDKVNTSTFSTAANIADQTVNQPDFNGSEAAIAWSGFNDNNFAIIANFSDWRKFKVGELITLKDDSGNTVVNNRTITGVYQENIYGIGNKYRVYWNSLYPLTQDYNVTGTSGNTAIATAKRFHCNGVIDTTKNVMENAKDLLSNMRGIFNYIEGKYELIIEDTGSSIFSINDSHIIEDGGISVDFGSKDQKANKVIVEFYNGQKKYELDTAISLHSASPNYFSDDGEILEVKAEFPFITDRYIADNMAKAILTRSRYQTQVSFLGTSEMYKLNVGDIVDLTYSGLGFSGKVFRIEALQLQTNGLVMVSMIEYFDVYTWQVPAQEPVADTMNNPSAFRVVAPANLAYTDTNSSNIGRPFLAWDTPTNYPNYQYRVNVVDSSGNQVLNRIVDVEFVDLFFIKTGSNFVASVTSLNQLGVESSATTLTFSVAQAPIVTTDIQDDTITTVKIGDAQITNTKINDINAVKINAGTVDTARIDVAGIISAGSLLTTTATISQALNVGSGTFTVDSSGNVVATSVTVTGKYNAKNISGTGEAGLFSELSDSVTGGSDPLRILCPSDDTDKDFFILMGTDPYSMNFSSGIPTSANKGLWFTGTGSIYMGGTNDTFAPLADNSNDLGASNYRWDDIYATNGTIQTSDANDKTNIENTDLGLSFISQLTPRKYKYVDGESNRTHYGLIAQEVKSVLDNNNIDTSDFAAYVEGEILDISNQGTGEYKLGLRYSEFISILIKSIQQLEERIKQLEN